MIASELRNFNQKHCPICLEKCETIDKKVMAAAPRVKARQKAVICKNQDCSIYGLPMHPSITLEPDHGHFKVSRFFDYSRKINPKELNR